MSEESQLYGIISERNEQIQGLKDVLDTVDKTRQGWMYLCLKAEAELDKANANIEKLTNKLSEAGEGREYWRKTAGFWQDEVDEQNTKITRMALEITEVKQDRDEYKGYNDNLFKKLNYQKEVSRELERQVDNLKSAELSGGESRSKAFWHKAYLAKCDEINESSAAEVLAKTKAFWKNIVAHRNATIKRLKAELKSAKVDNELDKAVDDFIELHKDSIYWAKKGWPPSIKYLSLLNFSIVVRDEEVLVSYRGKQC